MDKAQARHAKAMANKIKIHLQAMQWVMDPLVADKSELMPIGVVHEQFRILERRWEEIQSVLRDMESGL